MLRWLSCVLPHPNPLPLGEGDAPADPPSPGLAKRLACSPPPCSLPTRVPPARRSLRRPIACTKPANSPRPPPFTGPPAQTGYPPIYCSTLATHTTRPANLAGRWPPTTGRCGSTRATRKLRPTSASLANRPTPSHRRSPCASVGCAISRSANGPRSPRRRSRCCCCYWRRDS